MASDKPLPVTMALRCVLNRARPSLSRTFGRPYYYLPPPPPYAPVLYRYFGPTRPVAEESLGARTSAQFAVTMFNSLEDRNIKFVRLVRGTAWGASGGTIYYLTIEGIDENGYRNVYYADVYDLTSNLEKKLCHWELVDDMFEYPYSHDMKITSQIIVSPARQKDRPDYFRMMSKFEEHVGRSSNDFPDADAVQMCNIMDLGEALHYALYAVEKINKEGLKDIIYLRDTIHLRKLVYASRMDIGRVTFYHLLVEASTNNSHEVKLKYALVKESRNKDELIQWTDVNNLRKYFAQIGQSA